MRALNHIAGQKLVLLFTAVLITGGLWAQPSATLEAYKAYQSGKYQVAAEHIDAAVATEAGKADAMTWHIRGFIYKELFNQVDEKARDSENRDIAIDAFLKAMELDRTEEYKDNNVKSLRYLGSSYYNDAVLVMRDTDKNTIEKSEALYKRYKHVMEQCDPTFNAREKDITFYKALATSNRKIYEKDREANKPYLYTALDNYQYVLELDPDNYGANYNTAINLYNEGAHGIEQIDAEAQIPTIVKVQATSIDLFREALPYMLKAHELDPNRRETLIGLRGIYLSLNNNEKANEYRDLLRDSQQTNK